MNISYIFVIFVFHCVNVISNGLSISNGLPIETNVTSLRFVHVMWRHGDRNQIMQLPTDTGNSESTWPQGFGELTKEGMRQHFILGNFLKRRYKKYLSEQYNSSEIYVRSTDYNRTIMSALANMAGMYPPVGKEMWNENITWQPIPIHSRPKNWDPMLWMDTDCPNYKDLLENKTLKSGLPLKISSDNANLFRFLENKTGLKPIGLHNIYWVLDPFYCQSKHKDSHQWPTWLNQSIFDKLLDLGNITSTFWYPTVQHQRFRGSLLFYDIAERMKQRVAKNTTALDPKLKYYAYSTHDNTLVAILANFGVYDGFIPPYADAVIVELHERGKDHFVEIFQKNGTRDSDFYKLTTDQCNPCTVDKFFSMAEIRRPSNWWKECGLPEGSDRVTP